MALSLPLGLIRGQRLQWPRERGLWVGLGVLPPPVVMDPEAPSPEVLWQTCQVVSGCPAWDLGLQGHRRPWATQAQCSPTQAHARAHMTTQPCEFMVLTGGTEALRKAVGGVSALTRQQWQPRYATLSETHGQWCTVRDMMHEVGAQPPDHRTRPAGVETETGEACQRTSHSLLPLSITCVGEVPSRHDGEHDGVATSNSGPARNDPEGSA